MLYLNFHHLRIVKFAKAIIAPLQDILSNEAPTRRDKIWKTLAEQVERKYGIVNNNNKTIRMDNETICIVGRK
jgi:hypothetical protein